MAQFSACPRLANSDPFRKTGPGFQLEVASGERRLTVSRPLTCTLSHPIEKAGCFLNFLPYETAVLQPKLDFHGECQRSTGARLEEGLDRPLLKQRPETLACVPLVGLQSSVGWSF